jgi:hypothetical protein
MTTISGAGACEGASLKNRMLVLVVTGHED